MSFLREYGLFLAQTVTVVVAIVAVLAAAAAVVTRAARARRSGRRGLQVRHLNHEYEDLSATLHRATLPRKAARADARALRHERKAQDTASGRPKVFVVDFHGDLRASEIAALREEITAIVGVARPGDEVVVRLENPGGLVSDQGLAAAQLLRVRSRRVRLVVAVDKVAASGGYMMACVADRILAAPFAVVGSIGVVAVVPNVHRLLERSGVEVEQVTGGRFKRTVTPYTQTTQENREKLTSQIEDTHALFKDFVAQHRPQVDVEQVGTGEYWYGTRAVDLGLVDELVTSDDYLLSRVGEAEVYALSWSRDRPTARRLAALTRSVLPALARGT